MQSQSRRWVLHMLICYAMLSTKSQVFYSDSQVYII
jgi:hypothetical protein